jgi:hypothetical protein
MTTKKEAADAVLAEVLGYRLVASDQATGSATGS